MKRKYLNILFLLLLISCNKDNKKQYSTWYVNGQEFKSNNVQKDIGKIVSGIMGGEQANRFTLAFYFSPLPTSGTFHVIRGKHAHPDSVNFVFYYNNNFYTPYHDGSINIINNKKFRAELSPTWYKNYDNPLDTVLISGTFNEP